MVFDADSTLVGIEGIDWLAALRPADVAERIAHLTDEAMAGRLPLEQVYAARLSAVAPTRDEVLAAGRAYVQTIAPGAERCMAALRGAGCRLVIVSGGLRLALLPLAARLGIAADDVYGVDVMFGADGRYVDFDHTSPLARQSGKPEVVASLRLPRPTIAVGDGSTDLAIRTSGAADGFIAFTGYIHRAPVVRGADHVCASFDALLALLLSRP